MTQITTIFRGIIGDNVGVEDGVLEGEVVDGEGVLAGIVLLHSGQEGLCKVEA